MHDRKAINIVPTMCAGQSTAKNTHKMKTEVNTKIWKKSLNKRTRTRARTYRHMQHNDALNATTAIVCITLLILIAINTLWLQQSHNNHVTTSIPMPPSVGACLTRVSPASGFPVFWNLLFGQRGTNNNADDDDAPPVYDKDIEKKSHWTTADWIEQNKYALEQHNVTTSDGYQLQLHRLPQPGTHPILLVHGLFTSSLAWVMAGPGQSLAFLLHDKQYDVWLANLRGSAYARNHTRLNASTDTEYWNYSFHEEGLYDLSAIIEHIRGESSFHQVMLITHSQAFNAFLVLCAMRPEYNEKIVFVQALAPTVMLRNYVSFDAEDVQRVRKYVKKRMQEKAYELFPAAQLRARCLKGNAQQRRECVKQLRTFAGRGNHSKAINPLIYGALLQGGSLKSVMHLQQIWKSGDFAAYDYEPTQNLVYYNAASPHIYDLKQVTVPIVLHFGETDAIATTNGVRQIYAHLLSSIIGVYHVAAARFNHLDFFCANGVKTAINDKLIDIMEKYFGGTLKYVIE